MKITGTDAGETLTGTADNDTIKALGGDDTVHAGDGDDMVDGGTGNDTLYGEGGDDTLDGGIAMDTLVGGIGDDSYWVDNAGDVVTEAANEGLDHVYAHLDYTLGANVEDLTLIGTGNYSATGNELNNTITGNAGNNWIDGGAGADVMVGGAGDDTYVIDDAGDIVAEYGGEGTDTVETPFSFALADSLENLTLTGVFDRLGTGNAGANMLIGNAGNNVLRGLDGNDTINGGLGADSMYGGAGDDTFWVDNAGDKVFDYTGQGTDTVMASVTYSLSGTAIENLTLTGGDNINASGNGLDNILTGNSGDNVLSGGAGADTHDAGATVTFAAAGTYYVYVGNYDGTSTLKGVPTGATFQLNITLSGNALPSAGGNDTLNGGAGNDSLDGGIGADTMAGGTGDDTYYVDNSADVVKEATGEGNDTVNASASFSLYGAFVETLNLTGSANINATGNQQANILNGNAGINTLTGLSGNDTLDGKGGADIMIGGLGDDTYYVDNVGDTVTELSGQGNDVVYASATFSMSGQFIETLHLTGTADINGTGNNLDNILTGNDGVNTLIGGGGNDSLDGGIGADIMTGGIGNDIYYIDNGGDQVIEATGQGTDLVYASLSYSLGGQATENLTLTGTGDFNATGNNFDNVLTGNDGVNTLTGSGGNDTLDGKAGADTMIGGTGNDTYYVDNASDVVTEANGQGTDTIYASVSYSLAGTVVENLTLTGTAYLATGNGLDNILIGNDADNRLIGGFGSDTLTGGLGADAFWFGYSSGADIITDFHAGENDRINIHVYTQGTENDALLIQLGNDTVINFGGGNYITVQNTQVADLTGHIVW